MSFKLYINGQLVEGKGMERTISNPGTGETVAVIKCASKEQTLEALDGAQEAFKTWSRMSLTERGQWIGKLKKALFARKEELVDILSMETGKPLFAAARGFNVLVDALDFYYEEAKRFTGITIPDYNSSNASYHTNAYRPKGVMVGHLSWNMPLLNIGAKLGPTLASGCTCVLKPASLTPLSALKVGEIAESIHFPKGVFNIVTGPVNDVATVLNSSPIPRLITLIGSSETGKQVIRDSCNTIKSYSLELGGNAPAIVMPDADLEKAANFVASLKMNNCGQICTCVNRALVHEDVADEFVEIVKKQFEACKLGWGREEDVTMGPLITRGDRDRVLGLISDAVAHGANLVCGGEIPEDKSSGNYLTPALLTGCNNQMELCRKEIFGPALPVITFKTLEEAIEIANDTEYGLSAYAYTQNLHDAFLLTENLEAGEIIINVWGGGSPLPYAHGGVKESGIGKDWSTISLSEYYDVKRITMTP